MLIRPPPATAFGTLSMACSLAAMPTYLCDKRHFVQQQHPCSNDALIIVIACPSAGTLDPSTCQLHNGPCV
jgi:hypothetical protein